MSWFREWLRGPEGVEVAGVTERRSAPPSSSGSPGPGGPGARPPEQGYPGEHFGLPEHGPDSVATTGLRCGQFAIDLALGGVLANLLHFAPGPLPWWFATAVWVVLVLPTVAVLGQTPGMILLGMRVARVDGVVRVGLLWAFVRTLSLVFVVPALLLDRDSRGLHDRVSRTIVLRTR